METKEDLKIRLEQNQKDIDKLEDERIELNTKLSNLSRKRYSVSDYQAGDVVIVQDEFGTDHVNKIIVSDILHNNKLRVINPSGGSLHYGGDLENLVKAMNESDWHYEVIGNIIEDY